MNKTIWNKARIDELFELPFFELINRAYIKHQEYFDPSEIEFCAIYSIKTGSCPEDCAYCPQSAHYNTGLKKEKLVDLNAVITEASAAKARGAKRFCMGAAWRSPPNKAIPELVEMIKSVKALGLETCMTLGMLDEKKAQQLKSAGLDFYNHNLDTSPTFYQSIITTRTYQDRFDTIHHLVHAGIEVCCGGILGMGESREDRIQFLLSLYQLPEAPKSIPINQLIPIKGTPLENVKKIDEFEFIKMIAIARLMFPDSIIRLSAGRQTMPETTQAWCFMAGANSIWLGEKLLTTKNSTQENDDELLSKLGIKTPVKLDELC